MVTISGGGGGDDTVKTPLALVASILVQSVVQFGTTHNTATLKIFRQCANVGQGKFHAAFTQLKW